MGQALRLWVVVGGVLAGACNIGGAASPSQCSAPSADAGRATLVVEHQHQFQKEYEMFDVSYSVDGCQLFRVTDTAKLGTPRVDLGTHVIPAGTHVLLVTTFFRSGSSADMHAYEWGRRDPIQVELPAGSRLQLTARFHEERHDDPRQRMRVELITKVTAASVL